MWLRYKLSLKKVFTYIKMIMFIKVTFITQHGVHYINLRHSVFHHELHDWRVLAGQDGVPRFPDPFSWLPLESIYATIRFIPMAHATTITLIQSMTRGGSRNFERVGHLRSTSPPKGGGGRWGGPTLCPVLKSLQRGAKRWGSWTPPPWIRPWCHSADLLHYLLWKTYEKGNNGGTHLKRPTSAS